MAQNTHVPNDLYRHLVDEIHALQKALDQQFTELEGPRTVVNHIRELLDVELGFLALRDEDEQANVDPESRILLVALLRETANSIDPSLSTDFNFPEVGSIEWYGIWAYSGIMSETYHRVEFPPEARDPDPEKAEENTPECGICAEKYEEGDKDINFPCHVRHRMCTECMVFMLKARSVFAECPYCRTRPYITE
ncbi:uncharacterized protein MELLADRAFT_66943 [Melampsora larici-populina 98AG31]|uniref:RING-type domain-containing protein n=1 Tax=Melampsora larici-populina (strain 98AG31 / pathotype 3-4-7) TaxID=747676 RepID=F4S175_MELLP|nr:uncharacterized protein MELLADRAFT_66943 [Melampsora larici-populina 98AG31]EGG01613.1 hypothetical protein MELLADRAFT_66943 [Melampsora larici-populina 98AG31]